MTVETSLDESMNEIESQTLDTNHEREKEPPLVHRRSPRVLLAEDDLEMRRFLASALRLYGYEVTEAASGTEVLNRIGPYLYDGMEFDFDVIVSDIRMPGVDGLEILSGLRMCSGAPPVVLITAFGDRRTHTDAERFGAVDVLDKPFDIADLRAILQHVVPPIENS